MSNSYKLRYSLNQYSQSLDRFYEAIQVKDETLAIDGTIQRFEFTFELAWKTIKIFLQHEGILCNSPRSCLKEAFSLGLINFEAIWLNMLDDRNKLAHIYNEQEAKEIYSRISEYYEELNSLKISLGKII
ncbi:MAG: HI0074 family nucleotidyltransferase substrate-binding subunit [Candidatus Cloacimonadota bacterium]|nr:HI0074 family nucleotidyltransferase substrate-binding subunit [Candidatus Cloacimonadota bacterium]